MYKYIKPITIFLVFILVLGGFYWIFVRPGQIRKDCNNRALRYAQKEFQKDTDNRGEEGVYYNDDYNDAYRFCLRKEGL